MIPLTPSVITWGTPPTEVATMVVPTLVASINTTGRPSWCDGRMMMSRRHQRQGVLAVAEKAEPTSQIECMVWVGPLMGERTFAGCGECDRDVALNHQGRGLEKHLISLFGTEVGHGDRQLICIGHVQFGADRFADLLRLVTNSRDGERATPWTTTRACPLTGPGGASCAACETAIT